MILYIFDLLGVAVFAASGALAAGRKSLDLLGVFVIAGVTAIGGGTIRDVLLGRHPIFWMEDTTYLFVILAAALFTVFFARTRPAPMRALLLADAIGLAVFTIIGARIAEEAGLAPILVVFMGTLTGVAGGVVRDVLCGEVPLILRRDIYATASITGGAVYLLVQWLGFSSLVAALVGIAAVSVLRALAIFRGLRLPVFRLPQQPS